MLTDVFYTKFPDYCCVAKGGRELCSLKINVFSVITSGSGTTVLALPSCTLYPETHIPNGDPGMDPPAATALQVLLYFLPLDSIL